MRYFLALILLIISKSAFANLDLITWKGIFYDAEPIKKGISSAYCLEHTPGIVVHTTKQTREHALISDKGIKIDHVTLAIDQVDNLYLLHGDFYATASSKNKYWHDHIKYYLYKTSEAGESKGVWYSDTCKGKYRGIAIKNANLSSPA